MDTPRQQQQQQQQSKRPQKQQQQQAQTASKSRQQQRTTGAAAGRAAAADNGRTTQQQPARQTARHPAHSNSSSSSNSKHSNGGQQHHRSSNHSSSRLTAQRSAPPDDGYQEAQRRVRAVLTAADPTDPAAAAEQLPDTVNDLTIALQLLATAPRPTTLAAAKQYEAATQQLAAAVLTKYKRLLLRLLPPLPLALAPHAAAAEAAATLQHAPQQQQQLSAALASLPATKLAAAAFSLGVLRLYDRELVQGLEAASLQQMQRAAFKPNQLGQLVQGFVYLDHRLNPSWHTGFIEATRPHLRDMQGAQLASLGEWLTHYGLCGGGGSAGAGGVNSGHSSSSIHSGSGVGLGAQYAVAGPSLAFTTTAATTPQPAPAAAAATVASPGAAALQPDPSWVQGYLSAVGRSAGSLKPLQVLQVLKAAAGLAAAAAWQSSQLGGVQAVAAAASAAGVGVMKGLPVSLQDDWDGLAAAGGAAHHSREQATMQQQRWPHQQQDGSVLEHVRAVSGSGHRGIHKQDASSWVVPLVRSVVQQQLPDLTMAHLAAALPPLMQLTQCPWPPELLRPLLLQVKLQLPSCAGRDLVVVAQAAAHVAGPDALAAEQEWCDAVLMQLHSQFPSLGPAELAGAVHTAALLRVRPYKAWVYELCQRLRVDARAMDAQQVMTVLEGLAAVGVQLDPELMSVFVGQIQRWMGSLGADGLGRIVAALKLMYPKVLPGRTVHQLVDELRRRQQFLLLQARQQERKQLF